MRRTLRVVTGPDDGEVSSAAMLDPAEPVDPGSSLSLRRLVRQARGLSAVSIIGPAVAFPVSLLVARWTSPGDFGEAQVVLLAYMYAALFRSGTFEAASRAVVHHRARGEKRDAIHLQNVGVTVELGVSLLPGIALFVAAFFTSDPLRIVGFLLAPIAVLAQSLVSYFGGLYAARDRFDVVSKGAFVRALSAPLLLLVGVPMFGAGAIFVAPILADAITVLAFVIVGSGLGLRPAASKVVALKLLRTGFPLGMLAVVYWAYRLIGSTTVAIGFSAATFGVYAFAVAPVTVLSRAVAGLQAVVTPALWSDMAVDPGDRRWVRGAERVTWLLALVAAAATNIAQAAFAPLVQLVAPKYVASIPVFDILAMSIFFLSISAVPSLVLDSQTVNRQGRHLGIWIGALALNCAVNAVVLRAGWSANVVAWNDLWIQILVVVAIFEVARPSLGTGWNHRRTYLAIGACGGVCVATAVALRLAEPESRTRWVLLLSAGLRGLAVASVWGVVFLLLRRRLPSLQG